MFNKKNGSSFFRSEEPSHNGYKKEIISVLLGVAFVFLTLAFVSYNPHDNTLFHFSNKQGGITNWAGFLGAQCAALFFFLLGTSSYFFLVSLAASAYFLFKSESVKEVRGRLISLSFIVFSMATLCALYHLDVTGSVPGGFIGIWLAYLLALAFGRYGTTAVLLGTVWISIIIVARIQLMPLFKALWKMVKQGCFLALSFAWSKIASLWRKKNIQQSGDTLPQNNQIKIEGATAAELDYWGSLLEKSESSSLAVEPLKCETFEGGVPNKFASYSVRLMSQPRHILTGNVYRLANSVLKKNLLNVVNQEMVAQLVQQKPSFKLPDASLFDEPRNKIAINDAEQEACARGKLLEEKLLHFGVKGTVTAIKTGPLITLFEYKPEIDSKISKIIALEDDLAMALTATSIRILAPIPGKNVVGFEIANAVRQDVYFTDVLASKEYRERKAWLPLIFGVDVVGNPIIQDLIRMPHLLVGGATGAGKSVGLNAMITGLLNALTPDQMKLILIDPKRLEFTPYADIPHLIFPIVTEPARASLVLKWVCQEMEDRYQIMATAGVRNIQEYHKLFHGKGAPVNREGKALPAMPFLVVVIDELADLMMVAGKEVEAAIVRIAQMARASGIHMIVATQRPSVDVVTGLIKVNFPSRIAFRVSSKVDSRTILDVQGAERLLGRGDMLYLNASSPDVVRIHGAFVSDKEIINLAQWWREQQTPTYLELTEALRYTGSDRKEEYQDEIYNEVLEFVKANDEVSISMLQRYFRIGFNRSARLIEKLEMDGIISPAQGAKQRKVLR